MNSPQRIDLDGKLDRALGEALSDERDSILPSLGFADSVMAAVASQGPEPLRFPWKRALPGLIAGVAALIGFTGADLWVLKRMPAMAHATPALDWQAILEPIVQHAVSPNTAWTVAALLIPLVALWLTRRLLFSR